MLDFWKRHRDHSRRQETPTMQSPALEVLNPQDNLNFLALRFLVHQLDGTLYVNVIQSGPQKRKSAFRFARVLVTLSLVSVRILRTMSEQLVYSRAVTILRYTCPPPIPPHALLWTSWFPSWTWQKCNRLLRLGRPWGAVTLSRWSVSRDRGGCSARRGLKPKFYQSTQTMVTVGIFPFKENFHGRAGNRTRDLMISSQRLWQLDHEAGQLKIK